MVMQGVLIGQYLNCSEWAKTTDWMRSSPLEGVEAEQPFSAPGVWCDLERTGEVGRGDAAALAGVVAVDIVMMRTGTAKDRNTCLKCSRSHARLSRQRKRRCLSMAVLADEPRRQGSWSNQRVKQNRLHVIAAHSRAFDVVSSFPALNALRCCRIGNLPCL
jgi:hypothetical protein